MTTPSGGAEPHIDVIVYAHDIKHTSMLYIRDVLQAAGFTTGLVSVRNIRHYPDEYERMVQKR